MSSVLACLDGFVSELDMMPTAACHTTSAYCIGCVKLVPNVIAYTHVHNVD